MTITDRITSQKLRQKEDEVAMNDILRVVTAYDYEFVIAVNISTGQFKKYIGGNGCVQVPEQGDFEEQVRSAADCFVLPEDRQEYLEKMSLPAIIHTLEGQQRPSFTYRRRKPSGGIVWLKDSFLYASEDKEQVIITCCDTTQDVLEHLNKHKKMELQDQGIRFMAQNLCEDFLIADLEDGSSSMVTPDNGNMEIKGTFEEQIRWFAENILAPEEREDYLRYFDLNNLVPHIRNNNGFCTMNCTVVYKDGRHNFVVATTLIKDPLDPKKEYLFAYAQDITRLRQMENRNKELFVQSRRDPLTGLRNRQATEQDINEYLHASGRGRESLLFILDIDFFKSFNDTYGHTVGDEVLLFVAQSLQNIFRKEDIIGRWGGDEFILFLKEFSSVRAVTERIVHLRRKLKDFIVEGTSIPVSLSIGGAVSGEGSCSLEALFQKADMALYTVKREGRNGLVILDENDACRQI
jgi:signAling protein with a acyltransferase and GGDEF domains